MRASDCYGVKIMLISMAGMANISSFIEESIQPQRISKISDVASQLRAGGRAGTFGRLGRDGLFYCQVV